MAFINGIRIRAQVRTRIKRIVSVCIEGSRIRGVWSMAQGA